MRVVIWWGLEDGVSVVNESVVVFVQGLGIVWMVTIFL